MAARDIETRNRMTATTVPREPDYYCGQHRVQRTAYQSEMRRAAVALALLGGPHRDQELAGGVMRASAP
jgi:hypothetical protein